MKITSEKHTNKLKANKTVISSQVLNNNNNKIIPTVDQWNLQEIIIKNNTCSSWMPKITKKLN